MLLSKAHSKQLTPTDCGWCEQPTPIKHEYKLIKVQKHLIKIKHTSISCLTMKMQSEEGQTNQNSKMNNNLKGLFHSLLGINTYN